MSTRISDAAVERAAKVLYGPDWKMWCNQFALAGSSAIERRLRKVRDVLEAGR